MVLEEGVIWCMQKGARHAYDKRSEVAARQTTEAGETRRLEEDFPPRLPTLLLPLSLVVYPLFHFCSLILSSYIPCFAFPLLASLYPLLFPLPTVSISFLHLSLFGQ